MKMKTKRERLCIEIGPAAVKIAHVSLLPAKREVTGVITENISGLGDADISKVIKNSFARLKLKDPSVIAAIPSSLVITKNIEIPSTNPREIKEIIGLQAARYTPYSREEIMVDYVDIDTYKSSYTKILLVIVARTVVKRQFEIIERAGVGLDRVVIGAEGLARCLAKVFRLDSVTAPACLINIDESQSDFLIVFKNRPMFMRSISMGASQLLEDKKTSEPKFVDEIKRSFEAYQSEDIEKLPREVLVTGSVRELSGLEGLLKGSLLFGSRVVDYTKNISMSKEAADAAGSGASFLSVISPLLSLEDMKVGLIPEEVELKKSLEERGRDYIKTGILCLAVFILVFSTLISKIYFKSNYLGTLTARYETLHREAERLEGQYEKVTMIRNYLLSRGQSLEVISEVHKAAPIDLELNEIRYESGSDFVVKGTARSMSSVFSFVDNMEKSELFRDVKTRYTTKRREGTVDVTDFEVNCAIEKEGAA